MGKHFFGRLMQALVVLMMLISVVQMAVLGGHPQNALRPFVFLALFLAYLVWRERKITRDPEYARLQEARSRAQGAWWMFVLAVLGGVILVGLVASRDPQLEATISPYMEVGPLLLVVCGAPLFVLWRMRAR